MNFNHSIHIMDDFSTSMTEMIMQGATGASDNRLFCVWAFLTLSIVLPISALFIYVHWPRKKVCKVRPIRACAFRPELVPSKLDTIVIGSGSGGCACANLLAQSGQRVLILEQHPDRTGGCTHSFREKGCEWDTGLHYTSKAMSQKTQRPGALLNYMLKGGQYWSPLDDPYDTVMFPEDSMVKPGLPNSSSYPFVTGLEATVDGILAQIDPNNEHIKKRCMEYMKMCQSINSGFTALGLSRILPCWMNFLVKKRVEDLMRMASFTVRNVQYAVFNLGLTEEEILANGCPRDPNDVEPDPVLRRLKAVLTHPLGDYAVQPREATWAAHGITQAHYLAGAAYTVGATQNISIRSTSMVREYGGEVLVDATVKGIIIEKGHAVGVRVCNTSSLAGCLDSTETPLITEIRAKNIVCATSVYNLYNKFLPQDMPIVQKFHDPKQRSVRQSNGHVFLFCKIKGDADEIGLPTHNLWYFNGYDIDKCFDEYFANPTEIRPPTVYVGFPCTKDTTWKTRFPGVSNCVLISDGLYEWFEKWQNLPNKNRGEDYMAFKDKLAKHLLEILYETCPQVKGKIEYWHLGTPLSEMTYLASWHGGSYGTKCTPEMFAKINHEWTTTPHTSIPGLYLAGSDAFLPAVCGAMYGGCFGAAAVLGHIGTIRLLYDFVTHLAANIREENPKMSWPAAYYQSINTFIHAD